jgi:predicted DNA-binding transcriptional regulator YafY
VSVATGKLLTLLDLLESRPLVTGAEIARELGVDRRTVRRYVAALQALDIPVEGERGAGGGYRLRPGFRLPPLMLGDGEAAVVALGLAAVRRLGLGATGDVDAALAKVRRVLPDRLGRRVEALDAVLGFAALPEATPGVPGERLLVLAEAARRGRRVRFAYETFDGRRGEREVSPYGLVARGGRWYLAGFDHGRDALRTFRADRLDRPALLAAAAHPAPDGFDPVAHVASSLARVPWTWQVEVLLHLPAADARRRVAATLAEVEPETQHTAVLTMRAETLDFAAAVLAGLGCAFEIRRPVELREPVRALARRLLESAEPM